MEIAFIILAVYFAIAIAARIFAHYRKKNLLRLQGETIAIRVNGELLDPAQYPSFSKDDYIGQSLEYDIAYDHPMAPEKKTVYTAMEIVPEKASRFIERRTIPSTGEFEVLVSKTNPQKVEVGVEFAVKNEWLSDKQKEKNSKKTK